MISSGSDICFLRSVIVRKLHFWKAPGKICELYVCLIKWFLSPLPSVSLMFLVFPVGHRWSWAVMWSCMTVILQMERDRAQFPNGTDIIFQILTIHILHYNITASTSSSRRVSMAAHESKPLGVVRHYHTNILAKSCLITWDVKSFVL